MKNYLLIVPLFINTLTIAQTIDQPTIGANYMNQTYYSLNQGMLQIIPHTDWDIAFDVSPFGSGILVNEGVGLSFTTPLPEVELYYTDSTDFVMADTTGMMRIYNPEISWTSGAFNEVASPMNSFDLGWGNYNPTTHGTDGSRVFFIKLRNGNYKKLKIESLAGGVYTFKYADLDGSNDSTQTIDKANYTNKTLAYFSIENETALDLEPDNWDLLFTRYTTPLDDGNGSFVEYMVTGVLQNTGVQVVQADSIDPATAPYNIYMNDDYNDTLNTIGHDWKFYDFSTGWNVMSNQVFFVRTASDSLWRVQFLDFEGSSTGVTTLEKTYEANLTTTHGLHQSVASMSVFPNPVVNHVNIAFDVEVSSGFAILKLSNTLGQTIMNQNISITNGLNVKHLPIDLAGGLYYLSLEIDNEVITQPVFVK